MTAFTSNSTITFITPRLITGYQYGDDGHFTGTYQFQKNLDKVEIHCPPHTTLLPPPHDVPADSEAWFNGTEWVIRKLAMPWLPNRTWPETEKAEETKKIEDRRNKRTKKTTITQEIQHGN